MNQLLGLFILLTTAVSIQSSLLDKNYVNPYITKNIEQKLNSTMQNLEDALINNSMKLSEMRIKFLLNLENVYNNVIDKIHIPDNYDGKNETFNECVGSGFKKISTVYDHTRNMTRKIFNKKVNEIEDIIAVEFQMTSKQLLKLQPEMKKCSTKETKGTLRCIFYETKMVHNGIKDSIEDINDVNSLGTQLLKQLDISNSKNLKHFSKLSNKIVNDVKLCLNEKKTMK